MDFSELVADVVGITGREDYLASGVIQREIQRATLDAHSLECFPKDLVVSTFSLPTAQSQISVDLPTNCPRSRGKFALVRAYDVAGGTPGVVATKEELDTVIASDGTTKLNVYYIAGSTLNVKFASAVSGLLIAYYASPVVTPILNYSSWIAEELPNLIIFGAALRVARIARDAELIASARDEVLEYRRQLLVNELFPI